MKFSFVIPSYNRKKILEKCLQSIENAYEFDQSVDVEIVVVFCGINIEKSSFNLKFPELTITQYSEQNILSRAKNIGIEKAAGEYIILIDDDATIKEDFFNKLKTSLTNKPNVFCAKLQDPQTLKCFTAKEVHLKEKFLGRVDYNLFRGSAIIIKKNILKRVGMFNEKFGPGGLYHSGEESDLFFRIKMAGEDILFAPDIIIYHPTGVTLSDSKAFKYSYATGALLTKYCFEDRFHMPIYTFLIFRICFICTIRIIQLIILPKQMLSKNQKHRYFSVFRGLIMGILKYLKMRVCFHERNARNEG